MTLRSSLALATVMATTSLAASGPQDGRLWFKDEIDSDAILAGDFPERLHGHDLISTTDSTSKPPPDSTRSHVRPTRPGGISDATWCRAVWRERQSSTITIGTGT